MQEMSGGNVRTAAQRNAPMVLYTRPLDDRLVKLQFDRTR